MTRSLQWSTSPTFLAPPHHYLSDLISSSSTFSPSSSHTCLIVISQTYKKQALPQGLCTSLSLCQEYSFSRFPIAFLISDWLSSLNNTSKSPLFKHPIRFKNPIITVQSITCLKTPLWEFKKLPNDTFFLLFKAMDSSIHTHAHIHKHTCVLKGN